MDSLEVDGVEDILQLIKSGEAEAFAMAETSRPEECVVALCHDCQDLVWDGGPGTAKAAIESHDSTHDIHMFMFTMVMTA